MSFLFLRPVLLLLIVISALFSCTSEYSSALKVGTNIWPGYEPLYLARASGFWDEKSVNLIEFTSTSEVLRAFRNHSIDVAALTLDEAIALIVDRPDTRIIMGTDFSAGADVVIAQSGTEAVEQLKGKKIGVESTAVGAYMLARFLEKNHLTISDVEVVFLEVSQHVDAFLAHKVDAVVAFEPVRTQLLKHGGSIVFSSREIPGEILDVLVTREDLIKKRQGDLEVLVNGWFQSLQLIKEQRSATLLKMAPRLGMSSEELDNALSGLTLLDKKANQWLFGSEGLPIQNAAIKVERIMLSNGLLAQPVFGAEHLSNQFVGTK